MILVNFVDHVDEYARENSSMDLVLIELIDVIRGVLNLSCWRVFKNKLLNRDLYFTGST